VVPLPGPLIAGPDYIEDALDCKIYTQATVFLRGDAEGDGDVDMDDFDAISDFLAFGAPLACPAGADTVASGVIDAADSAYLLDYLTTGGPPPPAPFPICGVDPANILPCESPCAFIRGDADGDGQVDSDDADMISDYIFLGGPAPTCLDAADANDDGIVDFADPLAVLASLVGGGLPLPAPTPHVCGIDPTPDGLGCAEYVCFVPHDFRRGDCNVDASIDIADAIFALGILFPPPGPDARCLDACDANGDGSVDVADAVSLLGLLFGAPGPPLPPPYPDCGYDPTPVDKVGCEDYTDVECP
jgi:hypothetical protein